MIVAKTSHLASQVQKGETIGFSFHYHTKSIIRFLNSLLTKILSRNNIVFLLDTVITVLREIIVNAVKANSKRVYFKVENLDIKNIHHYSKGMESFKDFMVSQKDIMEEELKKSDYKVDLFIRRNDTGIEIFVRNNTPIHPDELSRIKLRIEKAKQYKDFAEVYVDVIDDIEGEGLGLLLTILFLRNSGIGENSLKITSDNKITQATLSIPFQLKPVVITSEIQSRVLNEVEELPTFPENVIKLQEMVRLPDIKIRALADRIVMDPALATAVLRLSNSAGFITRNRIETVDEAIKIIGLKNLNAILIAASARSIMENKYSAFKEIWRHSGIVAFYARHLALRFGLAKISDTVYLAGLLHDLGKIVLLSTSSKLSEWISEVTRNREIRTTTIIEEVSIGISHSTIGALIAKKWNLPEYLHEAIQNHHSPLNTEEEFRDVVFITYLANQMCGIETKKYDFHYFEEDVLGRFDINDEEKFNRLHEEMKKRYEQQDELLRAV
jgi:putative nucleotidyltransferase with HDIG domain